MDGGRVCAALRRLDRVTSAGSVPANRILFVDHTAVLGDAERSLLDIAVALRERAAVALFVDGPLAAALVSRNVAMIPIGGQTARSRTRKRRRFAFASIRTTYALARVAGSYGVLFAYSPTSFFVSTVAGLVAGRPVVWHLRDVLDDRHFDRGRARVLVTFANMRAARVVASTQRAADSFVACGGRRELVRVVHDGVDPAPFDAIGPEVRGDVRRALGIDEHAFVIGSFADAPDTQPGMLLDALELLADVIALVVGNARGDGEGVARLIAACDVIVLASDMPEPSALMKALLGRRPLIVNDAGSVREIVEDGATAVLVPPGDAAALAAAIEALRNERARGEELALAAFSDAHSRFSRATLVAGITRVADEVLSEQRDAAVNNAP
jgi:glycosyltransferase involved in cell wall biosynthesis